MKPLALITRPQPEADEFAAALKEIGYDTLVEPLFSIEITSPQISIGHEAAIVATSSQAIPAKTESPECPFFVMGKASEARARRAGYTNIISSDGDFARLVQGIRANIAPGSMVLYLRGDTVRHDLGGALPDYDVLEQIAYESHPIQTMSPSMKRALQAGQVTVIPLFSPRTADLLCCLIKNEGLEAVSDRITLLCLSPAVLDSASGLGWKRTVIAPAADSASMLDALRSLMGSGYDR